ncbi:uncharacterized protein Z518_06615 [Rhinocladiella mackenziei CBS 650.93]|uniref:YCII-related domain-containing protein n=1 Tax=Rhinocladiella mackenziei CBS 650.93 TaxID=1442369 RepID=A0A0D2J2E7_9EURO|nr:uncharacterized protein Z518_06615 [Rhinocladiella mackenziei CBS 650.93]KIX03065.1 hypothetical protein Z518_06615 [Rhinocladiella mackenziei CBS 650.93]
MPKFIYLLHATPEAESGAPPTPEIIEAMTTYNTSLSDAGMLLGGDGLKSSSHGARVVFPEVGQEASASPSVVKGPFDLSAGLICGFWLVKAKSLDEAAEWAAKAPIRGTKIEVREISGIEDMGEAMTEEVKEKERILKEKAEKRIQEMGA